MQLGFVLQRQGRSEEALARYREALRLDPGQRNARYLLGKVLAERGQGAEALTELRRCLEPEDGRTPVYLRTLAAVQRDQGDAQAARDSLQQARRLARGFGNETLAQAVEADLHRLAAQ